MTHKELKEQGYKLSRIPVSCNMKDPGRRNRRKQYQLYFLTGPDGKSLGSIRPLKDKPWRWGAHPMLKGCQHASRVRPVSDHKTVPEAAAALIRWSKAPSKPRRPPVTCPRCGANSKVVCTIGGVQERECHHGHLFTYDKWMADRLIWAPSAIGSLTKEGSILG